MYKLCLLTTFLVFNLLTVNSQNVPPVFINEIHALNLPGFADPFIEIAGPKNTNLDGWSLYFYSSGAMVESVQNLTGIIDNENLTAGALSFLTPNITGQIALVRKNGSVAQFLSLSPNTVTATVGPAIGLTSTYIGVFETGLEDPNYSLQQQEQFSNGLDFEGPSPDSPGDLNDGVLYYQMNIGAPIITFLEVTCLPGNTTEIYVVFSDANIVNGQEIGIVVAGQVYEDVPYTFLGGTKYELSLNIGSTVEDQSTFNLIRLDGNEGDAYTVYVALPSCGDPADLDGDGIANAIDNCPLTSNIGQEDDDNDGIGNVCELAAGNDTGLVGIGTTEPKSKLEVAEGDLYIKNFRRGIILTTYNGKCFRITVQDDGTLKSREIPCPEE